MLLFMVLWCFWRIILTKPMSLPKEFKLSRGDYYKLSDIESGVSPNEEENKIGIEVFGIRYDRYCNECEIFKPERTHHCSACGQCVAKKDHHCLYINNCISFANYKYFILFLTYTTLYVIYTALLYFMAYFTGNLKVPVSKFYIYGLLVLTGACIFATVGTLVFHLLLLLRNKTSREFIVDKSSHFCSVKSVYNLGKINNFKEVFGNDLKFWLFPIRTSLGNGYTFPNGPQ